MSIGAMIAAAGSRQGKTVVTAALARHYRNLGQSVQVIKLGPDYLDPMILEQASGQVVYNLDWWMMGEDHCRSILFEAARDCDVVLVEGLMGLHDNAPSNAWVADALGLSVLLVMNLAKYAQTAVAIAEGLMRYGDGIALHGVVGNLLGSQHHQTLVAEAMALGGVNYLGGLRRDSRMEIAERHLGLKQARELAALDQQLDAAAAFLDESALQLSLPQLAVKQPDAGEELAPLLAGKTIAIARDAAFGFIYPKNIATLQALGARCEFFSPLLNEAAPECDALWLPGGYPELYLAALESNTITLDSVRSFCDSGKPVLAECGGMMYLGKEVCSREGASATLCGVFDAAFQMMARFQSVGHQLLTINQQTMRGHSFHHSSIATAVIPGHYAKRRDGEAGESLYRVGGAWASYMHFYFASNPALTAMLFSE